MHGTAPDGKPCVSEIVVEVHEWADWIRNECYDLHTTDLHHAGIDMLHIAGNAWKRVLNVMRVIDQSRNQYLRRFE
jgi:hypothetical protein